MKNSLSLSKEEVQQHLDKNVNVTVRMKIIPGELISFRDIVRDKVEFKSEELDDKIIMKATGLPTYHMANVVDDKYMKISHVIRGEEWLSSTAHHVLLYRALGWESHIPQFAHIPLLLKPVGKGKLGKRDGAKFGFPVFPKNWNTGEEVYEGLQEYGILPEAAMNFLAFLGWNPGTDEEILSEAELIKQFSLERVNKSGARFDIEKGKWYNQQYIISKPNEELADLIQPLISEAGYEPTAEFLSSFCGLMKERVELLPEFLSQGRFFFEPPTAYDDKTAKKKYKAENHEHFLAIQTLIEGLEDFSGKSIQTAVKQYIQSNELGFGAILPILRIVITGSMQGPDIFETIALIGRSEATNRITAGLAYISQLYKS